MKRERERGGGGQVHLFLVWSSNAFRIINIMWVKFINSKILQFQPWRSAFGFSKHVQSKPMMSAFTS